MPLYLVARTEHADYDEYNAFVVRAKNEHSARSIAAEGHGATWPVDPYGPKVEVTRLSSTGDDEVILSSFNAG